MNLLPSRPAPIHHPASFQVQAALVRQLPGVLPGLNLAFQSLIGAFIVWAAVVSGQPVEVSQLANLLRWELVDERVDLEWLQILDFPKERTEAVRTHFTAGLRRLQVH